MIVALGAGLRADHAGNPRLAVQSPDERSYAKLAADLSEHLRYGDGSLHHPLHWPPGAPAFFAVGDRLGPGHGLAGAYWLQALAGTALILVVFALARVLAGTGAGLAAAAIIAIYPPLVRLSGELLSEGLGSLLLASATLCAVAAVKRPGVRLWAAAGALWGLTILTRADYVLAPLVIALLVGGSRFRSGGIALLAAAALTLTPVGPVRVAARGPFRTGHRRGRTGAVRRDLPARAWNDLRDEARARRSGPGA